MVCQGVANQFMHKTNPGDPNFTWFAMLIENHHYQCDDQKITSSTNGEAYAEFAINDDYRLIVKQTSVASKAGKEFTEYIRETLSK